MKAGQLDKRFRFDKRRELTLPGDDHGTVEAEWQAQFTCWANLLYLRRGEGVQQSRLAGVQPCVLSIRSSQQSREIATDWRAVDVRTGQTYNIRTVEHPTRDRIEMLIEGGVVDG